jgi:hypothetical protein
MDNNCKVAVDEVVFRLSVYRCMIEAGKRDPSSWSGVPKVQV